jgi:exosome complex RNA-binding protein Rrp4
MSLKEEKIILFPGEQMPFNRKLLPYEIFSFKKTKSKDVENHSLSCMKTVILYPNRIPKSNSKSQQKKEEPEKNKNIDSEDPLIPSIYYGNYYSPKVGDMVIGIITQKTYEYFKLNISTNKDATLNSIDFEGATRKTRPNLNVGDIVFALVEKENKYSNVTLTCKSEKNKKGWMTGESEFGELKDGKVFEMGRFLCLKFLDDKDLRKRLKECVKSLKIKIGMNGRIWIKADDIFLIQNVFDAIKEGMKLSGNEREVYLNKMFNK